MGNAWKANKFHADFVGENLISESGTYLPDFMGGGMYIDSTFGAAERFVSTPDVDLSKGTFLVTIEYEAETDGQNYSASSDSPGYWVVMGRKNVALDSENSIETFTVWMNRETKGYHIEANYNGSGYFMIKKVQIIQTNAYFGMRLLIGLFLGLLVAAIYYLSNKKVFEQLTRKQKNVALGVILVSILASTPLMSDYLYSGHDLPFHLLRIEGIKDALRTGQIPVRIQPGWFQGYGYASSIFYGEIFLYLPAIIRLIGFPLQTAYKIYIILINLFTCIIAYYCFKKIVHSEYSAFIGSLLYVLSPYRLGNIYIRGAVGEYTAMTFIPFIVAGLYLILAVKIDKQELAVGRNLLVFGFSGILQSHILSCLMTGFFTILVCLLFIRKIFTEGRWKTLLAGAIITIMWNLWFLIPFVSYSMDGKFRILEPGGTAKIQTYNAFANQLFDFFPNAYGSAYSISERLQSPVQMPLTIGFVLMGTIFVFLIYVWNNKKEYMSQIKAGKLCMVLSILALWMATTWVPWDALARLGEIPSLLIGNLQYGWRMLSVASVLLAAVAACLLSIVERNEERSTRRGVYVLYCVLGILCGGWFLSSIMNNSSVVLCRDRSEINEDDVTSLEYIPEGTDRNRFSEKFPIGENGVLWADYSNNHGKVRLICSNNNKYECGYLLLPLLNYKGYIAEEVVEGKKLLIENGDNNRIKVLIPPGFQGEIRVEFRESWIWRIGCFISFISIIVTIRSIYLQLRNYKQKIV